tara:strand:- start:1313 stop:1441 length:129 start_codon:yes stop_codon:yes gene_type:complete
MKEEYTVEDYEEQQRQIDNDAQEEYEAEQKNKKNKERIKWKL